MDFSNALQMIKNHVDQELMRFFKQKQREARTIDPELASMVNAISDLTLRGGKRIRPFLCWLGYEIAKESKAKKSKGKTDLVSKADIPRFLLDVMMGLELFHSFALIHDDIIDQDDARRGGDTIHKYFTKESLKLKVESLKLSNHFGTSMAILAGDLALAWADELMGEAVRLSLRAEPLAVIARNEVTKQSLLMTARDKLRNLYQNGIATSSRKNAGTPRNDMGTWKLYQQMKEQVMMGQTLDVMDQFGFADISRTKINELKTAWYSVVWPLTIGALLANAPQKEILRLQRYGVLVGQAFQLRDDLMDGDIAKEDFTTRARIYKSRVQKVIYTFPADDQRKKLLSDVAAFVVARDS